MTRVRQQNPITNEVPAYILAGGNSRRFGSDKARAIYRGRPIIRTLSDQLIDLGFTVTIVGKHDNQYADLGLATIGDIEPDQGPIGGLRTALTHRREGWILLCSCDMLGIDERWVAALHDRHGQSREANAVVARSDIWHPFPAFYHTRLLGSPSLRKTRSFQSLLKAVTVADMPSLGLPPVRQANTRAELNAAEGEVR